MSATDPTATPLPELFYAIADAGSAAARRYVVEHGLEGRVRFRNVYYDEARLDLEARGGHALPAYWDGQRLVDGEAPVLEALGALAEP